MLCSDAINEVTTNKELLVKSEVCHSAEHKGFYIYNYGSVAQLYNISATHYICQLIPTPGIWPKEESKEATFVNYSKPSGDLTKRRT